jgi:hypothetical protein
MDINQLQQFAQNVLAGIDGFDLKSYDFERDPDLNFKNI